MATTLPLSILTPRTSEVFKVALRKAFDELAEIVYPIVRRLQDLGMCSITWVVV